MQPLATAVAFDPLIGAHGAGQVHNRDKLLLAQVAEQRCSCGGAACTEHLGRYGEIGAALLPVHWGG
jgi:hypothetical protein